MAEWRFGQSTAALKLVFRLAAEVAEPKFPELDCVASGKLSGNSARVGRVLERSCISPGDRQRVGCRSGGDGQRNRIPIKPGRTTSLPNRHIIEVGSQSGAKRTVKGMPAGIDHDTHVPAPDNQIARLRPPNAHKVLDSGIQIDGSGIGIWVPRSAVDVVRQVGTVRLAVGRRVIFLSGIEDALPFLGR